LPGYYVLLWQSVGRASLARAGKNEKGQVAACGEAVDIPAALLVWFAETGTRAEVSSEYACVEPGDTTDDYRDLNSFGDYEITEAGTL
jgi:hypothetical protein